MADLPQLPERVRRKLALQWDELVEKHGFTGEHLNWPQTRRRKIMSEAAQPPVDIHSRTVRFIQARTGPTGPVYAHMDTVGIDETKVLVVERYAQLADEYFSFWLTKPGRRSEVFTAWLVELRVVVGDEVAQLWKERGDWFQRVCRAKLDAALMPIADESRRAAREIEIKDLGPENIPFEQVMERARETIEAADNVLADAGRDRVRCEQPPHAVPESNRPVPEQPQIAPKALLESRPEESADTPKSLIDDFCTQKGWSLDQLAEKAGIDRRQVFKVRNGRTVRPYVLAALGGLLGVEPKQLLPKR